MHKKVQYPRTFSNFKCIIDLFSPNGCLTAFFAHFQNACLKDAKEDYSLYFRDGIRRIDMVLAFEEDPPDSKEKKWEYRATYEENLKMAGLELELEHRTASQIDIILYFLHHQTFPDGAQQMFLKEGKLCERPTTKMHVESTVVSMTRKLNINTRAH